MGHDILFVQTRLATGKRLVKWKTEEKTEETTEETTEYVPVEHDVIAVFQVPVDDHSRT